MILAFPLLRACWRSGVPGWSRSDPVHWSSGRGGGPAAGPLLSGREDRSGGCPCARGLVRGCPGLVLVGPGGGPVRGRSPRPVAGSGVGAQHVRQGGPHAQDQDRQADTIMVTGHGARAAPAWARRW